MTGKLVREPINCEQEQRELDMLFGVNELAQRAAEILGYRALQIELPHLRTKAEKQVSLQKAMVELDIQPFNAKTVARYKRRMIRRATPMTTKAAVIGINLFALTCLASVVVCGACVIAILSYGLSPLVTPSWVIIAALISSLVLLVSIRIFGLLDKHDKQFDIAEWDTIPMRGYTLPIPEFALQTAVDLQTRCPAATFYIEELRLKKRTLDPFLVADDGTGRLYWLEVWNEPKFNQRKALE